MLKSLHHAGQVCSDSPLVSCYAYCGGYRWHWRQTYSACTTQPVVLIHGILSSSQTLVPLAEMISGWAPVFLPDLPGFGETTGIVNALTVSEMASALAEWMRLAVPAPAHFLGDSFGCQVAVEFALRFPQSVRSLTLLGPTLDPSARDFRSQASRLLSDLHKEPMELWVDQVVGCAKVGLKVAAGTMRGIIQDKIETKLPRVKVPTLVIRGNDDPIAPLPWARHAANLVPKGTLLSLPAGAHYVHFTHPGLVASAVRKFTFPIRSQA
jgi:2-hydroxy-6-oxonona-2,4-dienedioate hydrolase